MSGNNKSGNNTDDSGEKGGLKMSDEQKHKLIALRLKYKDMFPCQKNESFAKWGKIAVELGYPRESHRDVKKVYENLKTAYKKKVDPPSGAGMEDERGKLFVLAHRWQFFEGMHAILKKNQNIAPSYTVDANDPESITTNWQNRQVIQQASSSNSAQVAKVAAEITSVFETFTQSQKQQATEQVAASCSSQYVQVIMDDCNGDSPLPVPYNFVHVLSDDCSPPPSGSQSNAVVLGNLISPSLQLASSSNSSCSSPAPSCSSSSSANEGTPKFLGSYTDGASASTTPKQTKRKADTNTRRNKRQAKEKEEADELAASNFYQQFLDNDTRGLDQMDRMLDMTGKIYELLENHVQKK